MHRSSESIAALAAALPLAPRCQGRAGPAGGSGSAACTVGGPRRQSDLILRFRGSDESSTAETVIDGLEDTHPVIRWMAATLDGVVTGTGAVYDRPTLRRDPLNR
jgi:hypothetical protein